MPVPCRAVQCSAVQRMAVHGRIPPPAPPRVRAAAMHAHAHTHITHTTAATTATTAAALVSTTGSNSRIDHAVSDTITGPYKFVDVAIPTWSHNAAPIKLKASRTRVAPMFNWPRCRHLPACVIHPLRPQGSAMT